MTFRITDLGMKRKMDKALNQSLGCYTLADIENCINDGTMQSFVAGRTWIITQVHDFPSRKAVNIAFLAGNIDELVDDGLAQVEKFARAIDATLITATSREGWLRVRPPGWFHWGHIYAKELDDASK